MKKEYIYAIISVLLWSLQASQAFIINYLWPIMTVYRIHNSIYFISMDKCNVKRENKYIFSFKELVRKIQREYIDKNDVVIEGRDICTRIAPNADFKFY